MLLKYDLNLDCICSNGAEVSIANETHLLSVLSRERTLQIINELQKLEYVFILVTNNGNYIKKDCDITVICTRLAKMHSEDNNEIIRGYNIYMDIVYNNSIKVEDINSVLNIPNIKVLKIEIFSEQNKEKMKDAISIPNINIFSSHISNLEITPEGSSKSVAINYYRKLVKSKKIYSIGDGENDIDMFRVSDLSFAMGNASVEVKESASIIVSDVDHDGFIEALFFIEGEL